MSTSTTATVTAERLLDLPDDGQRHELVRGELRTMTPAGFGHGRVAANAVAELRAHARAHGLGVVVSSEAGFRIARSPDTVRAPDAAFVAAHRLPPEGEQQGFLDLAPDLVVEVVSPADRAGEVLEKTRAWLAAGVALVWLLYPAQSLVVVHGTDEGISHVGIDGALDGGAVLPGLRLPVADLFS